MRRIISLLLVMVMIISGCGSKKTNSPVEKKESAHTESTTIDSKPTISSSENMMEDNSPETESKVTDESIPEAAIKDNSNNNTTDEGFDLTSYHEFEPKYTKLNDPELLRYIEDNMYAELVAELDSDEYFVQNVSASYLSKEYIEELEYNSKENIFFGYTLSELDAEFQGTRYVFTLGDNGETTVKPFEAYDDTYEKVLKNVAIGTGVILVCVTVSVVTAGAGAPAVSMIFAASAKTGTIMALSSGAMGGTAAGIVTGVKTKDFNQAMKAAALAGSEGFKMGAISGAIAGGASEAVALKGATLNGLSMNDAAIMQKEGYPLDVIKEFSSMDQFNVCKQAGLKPEMINGKTALLRKIDLAQVDEHGLTNLERINKGLSPLDPDGIAYELHHVGQNVDSTLAILTEQEHRLGDMYSIWHKIAEAGTGVHANDPTWDAKRKAFWKAYVALVQSGGL